MDLITLQGTSHLDVGNLLLTVFTCRFDVHQQPLGSIEQSSHCNIKGTLFVVYVFENVVDMVVYCSHSVNPFFCSGRAEIGIIIKVNDALIEAM